MLDDEGAEEGEWRRVAYALLEVVKIKGKAGREARD
jgi:hypothetical protein